jgi:hypothetical protein
MNSAWTLLSEDQMRAIQPPESDHEARRTIAVLKRIARTEIEDGIRRNPKGTLFVNPQFSVEAPTDSPTFYAEATRRQTRWSDNIQRILGDRGLDQSPYYVSLASNFMTKRGVLHVAGRFCELGAGPNQSPNRQADEGTRALSRKITARFLRLYSRKPKKRPGESDSGAGTGPAGRPSVTGEHRNGRAR